MEDVRSDPALFELLLDDLAHAPALFRPTAYWQKYVTGLADLVRREGIAAFRSKPSLFSTFGATDSAATEGPMWLLSRLSLDAATRETIIRGLELAVGNPTVRILPFGLSVDDLDDLAYTVCRLYGASRGARDLATIAASLVGRPGHSFTYEGRPYTHGFLEAYWRYAYVAGHVDFGEVRSVVELGAGSGRQIEVLRKLHPHIRFYVLDLPPPIYVAGQYLAQALPGATVDYRVNRGKSPIRAERDGDVLLLGNWQIADIAPEPPVLFWNAASFAEMEPDVVANYLALAREFSEWVYLFQRMAGKEATHEVAGGVVEKTTFAHYAEGLGDAFELVDRAPARLPLKRAIEGAAYDDALWRRRPAAPPDQRT